MRQVNLTIQVSDNKFNQLLEFLSTNFGEVKVTETSSVDDIPEWQKVQSRLSKKEIQEGKAELIDWEIARQELFKKHAIK